MSRVHDTLFLISVSPVQEEYVQGTGLSAFQNHGSLLVVGLPRRFAQRDVLLVLSMARRMVLSLHLASRVVAGLVTCTRRRRQGSRRRLGRWTPPLESKGREHVNINMTIMAYVRDVDTAVVDLWKLNLTELATFWSRRNLQVQQYSSITEGRCCCMTFHACRGGGY